MASAPVGHPAPFPWATHDWSSVLLTKLAHESVLLSSGASFFPVDGGSLTIPKLTVDAAAAAWLDPGEEFPTDNVEGDSVKLTPKKLGLVTAIDVEAIEDADVNTLDVVGDSLARAIAQKLDARLFSTAAADKGPAGLLGRARERRRRLLDPELGGVQRVLGGDPDYPRTTDPWVSYDAGGRLYQIALSIDSAARGLSAVLASTSTNDGATWSAPETIQRDENSVNFNDKESITGDWTREDTAYAVWIRGAIPGDNRSERSLQRSFAFRGQPVFLRTTDGGETWSRPISMTGNQNVFAQGNQIAVLPDGTLVNVFAILAKGSGIQPPQANQVFMAVTRSTDGGRSWHKIERIAPIRTALLTDPDTPNPTSLDQTVRADDYLPDIAVDHATGDIYVVWSDGLGTAVNNVVITRSTDGGRNWSAPRAIDQTGAELLPAPPVHADLAAPAERVMSPSRRVRSSMRTTRVVLPIRSRRTPAARGRSVPK
jgi:Phage capsid family